jgi:hypothetical protein
MLRHNCQTWGGGGRYGRGPVWFQCLRNRDAGVIIYHQDAAQYFQQVFLHDGENLAAAKALPD